MKNKQLIINLINKELEILKAKKVTYPTVMKIKQLEEALEELR